MKEIQLLADKFIKIVFPMFKSNKSKKTGNGYSSLPIDERLLLWHKIKDAFIEEEEIDTILAVEQAPNNEEMIELFKFYLMQKLKQQRSLYVEIEKILAETATNDPITNVRMTHYGQGDQFMGNKIINHPPDTKK